MDHLHRLGVRRLARAICAFLLGLLIAVLAVPAFADYSPAQLYRTTLSLDTTEYPTADAACIASIGTDTSTTFVRTDPFTYINGNWQSACWTVRQGVTSSRTMYKRYLCSYGGSLLNAGTAPSCSGTPTCPAGQTFDTATASCKVPDCAPGQVRNTITQQCQPPCAASGTAGGSNYVSPYTKAPTVVCRDGCELTVGAGFKMPWTNGTTLYGVSGLVHTHNFCNGDINGTGAGNGEDVVYNNPTDPAPITVTPQDDPPRCKSGQCPGTVNGVYVCVACSDVATDTKPVTTYDRTTTTSTTGTPPNQTTTTSTADTKATHDGSGTVTSSTTTSTTTTAPNGSGGTTTTTGTSTEQKKESQESFCKENPTSAFCKEGKWSGSCQAQFSCEGDAVQCAIAKEIHQRNCDMNTPNDYSNLAETVDSGTETGEQYLQTQKAGSPIDVNTKFQSSIEASPISGQCPAPRTFSVAGTSFEISFEKPCELAGILGGFVMAFAYLSAALITLGRPI